MAKNVNYSNNAFNFQQQTNVQLKIWKTKINCGKRPVQELIDIDIDMPNLDASHYRILILTNHNYICITFFVL